MTYTEVVVPRKDPAGLKLFRNLCALAAGAGILGILFTWYSMPVAVVFGFLALRLTDRLDIEYQYYQLGNDFDIAKVIGGRKRKEIMTLNLEQVTLIAPVSSERMEAYENWTTSDYSAHDPQREPWAIICTHQGSRNRILIQMNDALYKALRRQLPGKVFDK